MRTRREPGRGDVEGSDAERSGVPGSDVVRTDVALVGGGGAGLAVLHQLALQGAGRPRGASGPLDVVVVDPLDRLAERPADRTWCSWYEDGSQEQAELAPSLHREWSAVSVVDPRGTEQVLDLGALRYAMVLSQDWYAQVALAVEEAVADDRLRLTHLAEPATAVLSGTEGALVTTASTRVVAAGVLDSRPAAPLRPGGTHLFQQFHGERVRTAPGGVDPGRAVLMDFSVPQPGRGLAFGYLLPSDDASALVEHTLFTPELVAPEDQGRSLAAYRARVLGAGGDVEHVERGVIPMTDAPFARRGGRRVVRTGTGGGAVRPSSGYAFAAIQRQARVLAGQLLDGAPVAAPRPHPRRHAWMDAVVLRALAGGDLDGADFFPRLFARNPPERVLRLLDGASTPGEDLALMRTSPLGPMLRAAAGDARHRVTGR